MATMAAASQSISVTCNLSLSSSTSSALASSSNVMLGMSDSAAGLRPLSLRSVPRRGPGDAQRRQRRVFYKGPSALFGRIIDRGTGGSGSEGKKEEKKFITKEQEPEQYWQTADEREGKNPMTTPLPYILILGVLSPFIILAVAFANNWIKIPVR